MEGELPEEGLAALDGDDVSLALVDLPLLATDTAVSTSLRPTTSGKVVTLEELAQMVRPRKPRPKPVPQGQLTLSGT